MVINSINGKPFDLNAKYAVITNNFVAAGGDTYYAFAAASSQFDTGRPLDEILMEYITEKLGGVVGEPVCRAAGSHHHRQLHRGQPRLPPRERQGRHLRR